VHDIGIWLGAYKPRMRLTGRLADGWLCPADGEAGPTPGQGAHLPAYEEAAAGNRHFKVRL